MKSIDTIKKIEVCTCLPVHRWDAGGVQGYGAQLLAIVFFSPSRQTGRANHRDKDDLARKSISEEKEEQTCFAAAAAVIMAKWNIRAWNSKSKHGLFTHKDLFRWSDLGKYLLALLEFISREKNVSFLFEWLKVLYVPFHKCIQQNYLAKKASNRFYLTMQKSIQSRLTTTFSILLCNKENLKNKKQRQRQGRWSSVNLQFLVKICPAGQKKNKKKNLSALMTCWNPGVQYICSNLVHLRSERKCKLQASPGGEVSY